MRAVVRFETKKKKTTATAARKTATQGLGGSRTVVDGDGGDGTTGSRWVQVLVVKGARGGVDVMAQHRYNLL